MTTKVRVDMRFINVNFVLTLDDGSSKASQSNKVMSIPASELDGDIRRRLEVACKRAIEEELNKENG